MTLQRIVALALVLAVLPFAACDDADPTGTGTCGTGTLTASAAGETFSSECVTLTISNDVLTITGTANIDGSAGANQQQISVTGAATSGSQNPTVATYADVEASDPTGGLTCTAVTLPGLPAPTLTIEALGEDTARGTFAFRATCSDGSTINVTNGRFDIAS